MGVKKSNRLKKFKQVGDNVTCILVGMVSSVLEIFLIFEFGKISLLDHDPKGNMVPKHGPFWTMSLLVHGGQE